MISNNAESRFAESELNNIALVKRMYSEVWNDRCVDRVAEIISPNLVLQYDQGELKGINNWREKLYDPLTKAFPDGRIEIEDIVAHGDVVITRWKARGHHEGALFGVSPSGGIIEFTGISWMKIFDGKIVTMWNNWDISYLLQRLLKEVKELRGIIPICSYCKNIRNDKGAWEKLEVYICNLSDANFSHGICDECYQKYKDELI